MSKIAPQKVEEVTEVVEAAEPKVAPEVAAVEPEVESVYVVAVYGSLTHLFTNVVFTNDPKKVQIDGFLQAQIDAGKLEIVTP